MLPTKQIQRGWRERVSSLVAACGSALRRYVQDWPLSPEKGPRWGLDCALVDELWFENVASLRDTWSCAAAMLAPRDDALCVPPLLVVARQVVLYPAPASAAN